MLLVGWDNPFMHAGAPIRTPDLLDMVLHAQGELLAPLQIVVLRYPYTEYSHQKWLIGGDYMATTS